MNDIKDHSSYYYYKKEVTMQAVVEKTNATQKLMNYIAERGFKLSVISRETGISPNILYNAKRNRKRLDVDDYGKICMFIKEDPNRFIGLDEPGGMR